MHNFVKERKLNSLNCGGTTILYMALMRLLVTGWSVASLFSSARAVLRGELVLHGFTGHESAVAARVWVDSEVLWHPGSLGRSALCLSARRVARRYRWPAVRVRLAASTRGPTRAPGHTRLRAHDWRRGSKLATTPCNEALELRNPKVLGESFLGCQIEHVNLLHRCIHQSTHAVNL
jgi:hypothetical protein